MGVQNRNYTFYRGVMAEGGRIGIVTCKRCGVALLLDPDNDGDVMATHDTWHRTLARILREVVEAPKVESSATGMATGMAWVSSDMARQEVLLMLDDVRMTTRDDGVVEVRFGAEGAKSLSTSLLMAARKALREDE